MPAAPKPDESKIETPKDRSHKATKMLCQILDEAELKSQECKLRSESAMLRCAALNGSVTRKLKKLRAESEPHADQGTHPQQT